MYRARGTGYARPAASTSRARPGRPRAAQTRPPPRQGLAATDAATQCMPPPPPPSDRAALLRPPWRPPPPAAPSPRGSSTRRRTLPRPVPSGAVPRRLAGAAAPAGGGTPLACIDARVAPVVALPAWSASRRWCASPRLSVVMSSRSRHVYLDHNCLLKSKWEGRHLLGHPEGERRKEEGKNGVLRPLFALPSFLRLLAALEGPPPSSPHHALRQRRGALRDAHHRRAGPLLRR